MKNASSTRGQSNPRLAAQSLSDRCRRLGLATWAWDLQSRSAEEPSDNAVGERWFASPILQEWIAGAVRTWSPHSPPTMHELFPGCWLLPLGGHEARRGTVGIVAMALGQEALRSDQFEAVCKAATLDTQVTRAVLQSVARYERADLDQLSMILRWLHDDLVQVGQDRLIVQGFSAQLADAYEHMNVLYRLGLSMKRLDRPEQFVQSAIVLLQQTLRFGWIAVLPLQTGRSVTRGLEELVVAGELPGSRRTFSKLIGRLDAAAVGGEDIVILEKGESELASFVGSQVIVCAVESAGQVKAALVAGNKSGPDDDVSSVDTQLLKATAGYLAAFIQNVAMFSEQHELFVGTLRALTATIDAKDKYTRGHSARVAWLASQLATAAECDEEFVRQVGIAGLVHDIGKIGVPESVLGKRGDLTDEEFDHIKRHPVIGYDILKDIPPMSHALPAVLHHHERWDGGGYPEGRRGENIPLAARIITVADIFDAMSSDRTYRDAMDRAAVLREIEQAAGTQLDPQLARLFLSLDLNPYDAMVVRHKAQERQAA